MRYKEIHIFAKFSLCLFTDVKKWNEVMLEQNENNHLINEDELDYTNALTSVIHGDGLIISMFLKKDASIYTVMHESIHVVDFLIENIGLDHTEFRAYTAQYLVENIMDYLNTKK